MLDLAPQVVAAIDAAAAQMGVRRVFYDERPLEAVPFNTIPDNLGQQLAEGGTSLTAIGQVGNPLLWAQPSLTWTRPHACTTHVRSDAQAPPPHLTLQVPMPAHAAAGGSGAEQRIEPGEELGLIGEQVLTADMTASDEELLLQAEAERVAANHHCPAGDDDAGSRARGQPADEGHTASSSASAGLPPASLDAAAQVEQLQQAVGEAAASVRRLKEHESRANQDPEVSQSVQMPGRGGRQCLL
jgi:hypothetical protein